MSDTYPCVFDFFVYLCKFNHLVPQLSAWLIPLGPEQQSYPLIRTLLLQFLKLLHVFDFEEFGGFGWGVGKHRDPRGKKLKGEEWFVH